MFGFEDHHISLWWVLPLVMMLVCVVMMLGGKRRRGCWRPKATDRPRREDRGSAKDILDMRFASGEIDQEEYEARKTVIFGPESFRQPDL